MFFWILGAGLFPTSAAWFESPSGVL